jgi:[ribosomal protein S5]-alanine N-acetyltransferase
MSQSLTQRLLRLPRRACSLGLVRAPAWQSRGLTRNRTRNRKQTCRRTTTSPPDRRGRQAAGDSPWVPVQNDDYFTADGQRAVITSALARHEQGSALPHVILGDSGRVAGRITLNGIVRGPFQSCSLGYWVSAADNGRGLATAAVRDITSVAFEELGLHRIQAETLLHNVRSRRVLERNGFVRFGHGLAGLAAAGRTPDQSGKPGGPDDLRRRVQFCQRPPSPCGDPIRGVHRGDVPELAAGPVSPRQKQALVLPDDPAAVLHRPHVPVNLTQHGNIVPAGLLSKLTARRGRIGLARVQAPAGSGPVPPVRRIVVVSQ